MLSFLLYGDWRILKEYKKKHKFNLLDYTIKFGHSATKREILFLLVLRCLFVAKRLIGV